MITKERLLELLVRAGEEIGILPKRMPAGWQRFAELVEQEVRANLKDVTHVVVPQTLPPLEEAWRRYYDKGYRYSNDAMEQVRLGYRIACEELARQQMPVAEREYGGASGGGKSVWSKLGTMTQEDRCPHASVPSSCAEVQCFMTKTCKLKGTL